MRTGSTHIILATFAIAALFLVPAWIERLRQPVYEGRRVGEWFDDVCLRSRSGLDNPQRQRMNQAMQAFSSMDSNAVPFLVRKLRTPSSRVSENLIMNGRKMPVAKHLFNRLQTPIEKRRHAATALNMMGSYAESALPSLLVALDREPDTNVAQYIVAALGRASGFSEEIALARNLDLALGRHNGGRSSGLSGDINKKRDTVLNYIRVHHPHLFPAPSSLIPLGTNALTSGTLLYNRHTTQYWATVLEVDRAYEFADGTNQPAALIETKNGSEWVPRERLNRFLTTEH